MSNTVTEASPRGRDWTVGRSGGKETVGGDDSPGNPREAEAKHWQWLWQEGGEAWRVAAQWGQNRAPRPKPALERAAWLLLRWVGDRELVPGPTRDTDSSHVLSTGTCSRTSFPASWTLIPHTARRLTGSEGQRGGALGSGSSLCSPQPHRLASPRASHRGWPSRHGPAVQHQVSGPSEPHASYGFTGQPGSGVASFKPLTYGAACDTSV